MRSLKNDYMWCDGSGCGSGVKASCPLIESLCLVKCPWAKYWTLLPVGFLFGCELTKLPIHSISTDMYWQFYNISTCLEIKGKGCRVCKPLGFLSLEMSRQFLAMLHDQNRYFNTKTRTFPNSYQEVLCLNLTRHNHGVVTRWNRNVGSYRRFAETYIANIYLASCFQSLESPQPYFYS